MHLINALNIEHKKKNIFLKHIFCGNKEILGHFCKLFYFRMLVRLPLFTCGMTSLHSSTSRLYSPDWWLVMSCKHYSLWSTTKESEINKLWRLLLTWHFTSPCVNQIFNQKLGFVYYGIMYFECEYLIRCAWCFKKCQFVSYAENPLEHIPPCYMCSLVQFIGV